MTDTTTVERLPDLMVRTSAHGDRFVWRLVTFGGEMFLTSERVAAATEGVPATFETRQEARIVGGRKLLELVEAQVPIEGEIVTLAPPAGILGRRAA